MLEEMVIGYRWALQGRKAKQTDTPECIKIVVRKALSRTWKHLAEERLEDVKPRIPLGDRFWPLSKGEALAIGALFTDEDVCKLVTAIKARPHQAKIEVLDAAYWMKGCSSCREDLRVHVD
jgi:hypothetical protein